MHVEAPHLVEAEDVIGVAVREEDRVDARDAVRQRLLRADRWPCRPAPMRTPPSGRVDLEEDRRAGAAIARIGRPADGAVAADHRHAVRRAGAEKRDPKAQ